MKKKIPHLLFCISTWSQFATLMVFGLPLFYFSGANLAREHMGRILYTHFKYLEKQNHLGVLNPNRTHLH